MPPLTILDLVRFEQDAFTVQPPTQVQAVAAEGHPALPNSREITCRAARSARDEAKDWFD